MESNLFLISFMSDLQAPLLLPSVPLEDVLEDWKEFWEAADLVGAQLWKYLVSMGHDNAMKYPTWMVIPSIQQSYTQELPVSCSFKAFTFRHLFVVEYVF